MATLAIQTKLSVCDNQMRLLRSFRGCTLLCRIRATGICQFLFHWTILKAINWHCFYFDWYACDCTMIWLLFFLFFWKKELHDDVKEEHKLCNFELWTSLDKIHPFWISLKTLWVAAELSLLVIKRMKLSVDIFGHEKFIYSKNVLSASKIAIHLP